MIIAGTVYGKQNEYEEFVVDVVDSLPSTPIEGQLVWNTIDKSLCIYDGSNWKVFMSSGGSATFDTITVLHDSDLGRHVYIHDEMVTLNYGETGTGIFQWGTDRAGIEIDRGSENTVSLFYDETTDKWSLTNDGVNTEIIMTYDPSTGAGTAANYFLRLDGGNSPVANISWSNFRITNLGEPTDLHDAANKLFAIKMAIVLG